MSVIEETVMGIRYPDRFFIGGEWVMPRSKSMFEVRNSATEEVLFRVAEANEEDMNRAILAAREAFDSGPWPRMGHLERADYLREMAHSVRDRAEDIAKIWSSEMGILHSVAATRIPRVVRTYDFYASLGEEYPFIERHQPTSGGQIGLLVREPVGVVGAIVPWNTPMSLIAHKVAPALLAGCTVIIKASPEAPGTAYLMGAIAREVGLPPGVLNVVTADRQVSELLVRDSRVDKIAFTGSTAAGRRIASLCGERIARFSLELGGKSAAVVLDDYDVSTAADTLARSAIHMTSQVCSSLTRIVVGRQRHDELVEALSTALSRVQIGDPFDPSSEMGPLATQRQRDRVEGFIAKGIEEGARLASGGSRPSHLDCGYFIEPTVFGNVSNSSTIAREEIFGPVLSVIPADDENEAVEIANDSIYGLNASVFTNDDERALQVARRLRSGTVGHNAFRTDFGIAFGGFKQSGIGREGGREGLLPYLETKTIILDSEPKSLGL
jgi:aldehyde dehydrogenase (NAD+)